ncbi:MAG: PTS sugar transporter subunit IIB [Erysipelotrichaceae bacterium]|nr:PTS sugar transporter subunit IIB [Erysipelotrichaceae bacterium]MDY5252968.1 PTS sugar transporter subunit IIB [Erysipelotrichaceae bacterium]
MKATIKLIRVDNRLVHGQVGITWTASLDVDTIIVVDDEVALSSFPQRLMLNIAKAANVKIRFYSVSDFIKALNNESKQKIFVVVKTIQVAKKLAEANIQVSKINIGNIHYDKGRIPFNKKVYLTKEDIDDINYIIDKGYNIFYQDVPGTIIEKITSADLKQLERK